MRLDDRHTRPDSAGEFSGTMSTMQLLDCNGQHDQWQASVAIGLSYKDKSGKNLETHAAKVRETLAVRGKAIYTAAVTNG